MIKKNISVKEKNLILNDSLSIKTKKLNINKEMEYNLRIYMKNLFQ